MLSESLFPPPKLPNAATSTSSWGENVPKTYLTEGTRKRPRTTVPVTLRLDVHGTVPYLPRKPGYVFRMSHDGHKVTRVTMGVAFFFWRTGPHNSIASKCHSCFANVFVPSLYISMVGHGTLDRVKLPFFPNQFLGEV